MGRELLVRLAGPALAIGAIAGAAIVVIVKVWGTRLGVGEPGPLGWAVLAGVPVMLSLVVAGMRARRRWPTRLAAASALDEVSGTHDLLGTSLALESRGELGAFERLALHEAEAAAAQAKSKDLARVRLGPPWGLFAASAALAGVIAWLAPMRDPPLPGPAPIVRTRSPEAYEEAAAKVAEAKEAIESASATGQVSAQELAAIEELERELAEGLREPEEALAAAAETLERSAEEAAKRAERESLANQALHKQFSSVDPGQFEAASELASQLAESDLEAAAAEAERLLNEIARKPEAEQQQFAEELRKLAEQLDREQQEVAVASESEPETRPEPEPKSAEEIREQLEREGVPPEDADRLAQEMSEQQAREQAEREAEREAREETQKLAEDLRREADELSPPPEPDPDQSETSPNPSPEPSPQGESGEQGNPQPRPANSPAAPEQAPGDQGQPKEGEPRPGEGNQPSEPGNNPNQPKPGEQPSEQPGSEPGEKKPTDQPADPPGDQPGDQPDDQPGDQPGDTPGEGEPEPGPGEAPPPGGPGKPGDPGESPAPGNQPGDQPGNQPGGQPGNQPGQKPGSGKGPGEGEGPGSGPDVGQRLRQLAERQRRGEDSEDAARELKDKADELTGRGPSNDPSSSDTPAAPPTPWQGETQFVDAREQSPTEAERESIISEWFNPAAKPDDTAPVGTVDPGQSVREAQQRAQRALEQQAVPRRHADLIKRVYDRFGERAKEAQRQPKPTPADAKDAP